MADNCGTPHPEDYIVWVEQTVNRRELRNSALDISFYPDISTGWDNTPRFPETP